MNAETPEAPEDLEATWRALLERRAQLNEDPELAGLALRLIQQLGNGAAHREVLRDLMRAWSHRVRRLRLPSRTGRSAAADCS